MNVTVYGIAVCIGSLPVENHDDKGPSRWRVFSTAIALF